MVQYHFEVKKDVENAANIAANTSVVFIALAKE
jgi:hypothetical protein